MPDSLKVCGTSNQPERGRSCYLTSLLIDGLSVDFQLKESVFTSQAHEVLCLEMLTLLLERPTDDSVEVAISFLKECGLKLTEVSPRGINGTS